MSSPQVHAPQSTPAQKHLTKALDEKRHEELLKPDKPLDNWKRWMEIRKNYHEYVKNTVGREAGEMISNKEDAYRKKMQDRLRIEYSRIPKPDKVRGCPNYWIYPCGMPSNESYNPIYGPLTQAQRCKVPSLEEIGTPQTILKEKHINPIVKK